LKDYSGDNSSMLEAISESSFLRSLLLEKTVLLGGNKKLVEARN
jgi:hypothetical protein